jgi:hypothetical protein
MSATVDASTDALASLTSAVIEPPHRAALTGAPHSRIEMLRVPGAGGVAHIEELETGEQTFLYFSDAPANAST